jgi:hypothetical protein
MFPFADLISGSTLIWTTVLVLLVIGVALSTMVRARPTRSIAHVLHDAEQPDSKS